jgi:hypothetical protein
LGATGVDNKSDNRFGANNMSQAWLGPIACRSGALVQTKPEAASGKDWGAPDGIVLAFHMLHFRGNSGRAFAAPGFVAATGRPGRDAGHRRRKNT